jgi:hypothetical protein
VADAFATLVVTLRRMEEPKAKPALVGAGLTPAEAGQNHLLADVI